MACDQTTLELLSTYVDGEATPEETARARAHLDTCTDCREMVQEWRRGLEMLDWTYAHALPEGAEEPAFQPSAPPERTRGWSFSLPSLRGLAVAAVLALIALTGLHVYQTVTYLPTLGQSLSTAQKVRTVLVAKGIRLEIMPDTEISRLGDKAIRLVQGTIKAEVTHGTGFVVRTRKLEIIDQGTEFEVHSDPSTDRVTVTEGRVLVRKGTDEYQVNAGETLTSTELGGSSKTEIMGNGGNSMPSGPHSGVNVGFLPILVLAILVIVFWVKMLVDALTREFKDGGSRIAWVLAILLGQMLGALIYYAVVYSKDRPRRPFVLVGRRGDQRVIMWWNIVVATVGSGLLFGYLGLMIWSLIVHELSKTALLVGALIGIVIVLASVLQALAYPMDMLIDVETREVQSTKGARGRHSLLTLAGRRNGRRVILWQCVVLITMLATVAASALALGIIGLSNTALALSMVAAVFAVFLMLSILYALLLPVDKLPSLDNETPPGGSTGGRGTRRNGLTPLILAVTVVLLLVGMVVFTRAPRNRGDLAADSIIAYAAAGNIQMVTKLLDKDPSLVNARPHSMGKQTPLHQTAIYGQRDVAELLLSRGADVNGQDEIGRTPMHIAVGSGRSNIVQVLVAHKADVNVRDRDGTTPLMVAIPHRQPGIAKMLLNARADVNAQDANGASALHICAKVGEVEIARMLINAGADVNSRSTPEKLTPLAWAVDWGSKDVARLLLAHGADRHIKDANGETALRRAVRTGHPEMAEILR